MNASNPVPEQCWGGIALPNVHVFIVAHGLIVVLQGAKIVPLLVSVGVGLAIRFVAPIPAEITPQAWTLLSIFISTIAGTAMRATDSWLFGYVDCGVGSEQSSSNSSQGWCWNHFQLVPGLFWV